MKSTQVALIALLFAPLQCGCTSVADDAQEQVTPVQKVIELMNGMMSKGKKEKQDEQVQFAAYKTFCEETSVHKTQAIADANEQIDMLKADIQKYTTDAEKLSRQIAAHDEDISVWNGDIKAATTVRTLEKNDYDAKHKDLSESVDALNRALAVLKEQAYNRKQASFVQVQAVRKLTLIPKEAKQVIDAFLQQTPDEGLAVSAPEAYGYEFQSKGVVELLEKLQDKFIQERTQAEKEEMNTANAFDMLIQDLTHQVKKATRDRDEKAAKKAKTLQAKADAEGDLNDTITTRDADQKYLDDLVATCEQKATDFESRQTLRIQELQAIQKAIEIIDSEAVSGNADKYLPTLLQIKASSVAQLASDASNGVRSHVVQFLQNRAQALNSKVLAALAVRAGSDPFRKVRKMIKDLINRLMEEAQEETEHKGWCDTELSTNEQTRKEKTVAVETLHAEIDELSASITKLAEDIQDLTEAVAELDAAMAKATKVRAEEKATNEQTIEDAKASETAVAQALLVLKEFYAKAGDATALLQQQPEAPEIFDSPYKGMQAENGGIVGMLEVIQQDFARLGADTASSEATAQKAYDAFMEDSRVDKAEKTQSIEHKTSKKQNEETALTEKKSDVEGTQKELDAALAYFDKLKPSCINSGVSYEDRVARRQDEIESLQDALRILNGEESA